MSWRLLLHSLQEAKVGYLLSAGALLVATEISLLGGTILLVLSAIRVGRIFRNKQDPFLGRLYTEQRKQKISKRWQQEELNELYAIEQYRKELEALGTRSQVAQSVMEETWDIIRAAGTSNASKALRDFRLGLPALDIAPSHARQRNLREEIRSELNIVAASIREVDSLG